MPITVDGGAQSIIGDSPIFYGYLPKPGISASTPLTAAESAN